MGQAFVHGYIGLAEGEKDPRNLLLSFAIVRVLLIEFDVKPEVEVSPVHPLVGLETYSFIHTPRIELIRYHLLLLSDIFQAAPW